MKWFCVILFAYFGGTINGQFIKFRVKPYDSDFKCNCVIPELCADDDALVNGDNIIDPRISNAASCPKSTEICCEFPKDSIDDNYYDDNNIDYKDDEKPEKVKSGNICGISPLQPTKSRLTFQAKNTEFSELPWSLLVLENFPASQKNLFRCGATLIHPKVALTAAHCVASFYNDPEKLTIRAGEYDTSTLKEPLPYQDNNVQEILIHPHYNYRSLRNDIALLFLDNPFVLADNVGIICLPHHGLKVMEDKCLASGWGRENLQVGKFSAILRKIELSLVPRQKCVDLLRNTKLGKLFNLHRSFICAGGEKNRDACKGDGGGPLLCPVLEEDNMERIRFVQSGIVSWGVGCGQDQIPGIYVNVELYSDWIDEEMINRDLDISIYRLEEN